MIAADVSMHQVGAGATSVEDARTRSAQGVVASTLYIDAHVHLHPGFGLRSFLDAAWGNVQQAAGDASSNAIGVLLLAETTERDPLAALARPDATLGSGWTVERSPDGLSIIARQRDVPRVIIVAGRQLQTAERLEVLALACDAVIPHGQPIDATIHAARDANAIVVLPWGVGKWWGRRGRIVHEIIEGPHGRHVFLGDNGGRPRWTLEPRLFGTARSTVLGVLPGSDPFPFPREVAQVGRYGFVLDAPISLQEPAANLRRAIHNLDSQPPVYGHRVGAMSFLRRQMAMRWRRDACDRPAAARAS